MKMFELKLLLDNKKYRVETTLSGDNVAEITQQIPEALNVMVRGLAFHESPGDPELKRLGVISEQ